MKHTSRIASWTNASQRRRVRTALVLDSGHGTGPSLGAYGLPNPLANPMITLIRSSDQPVVASNDNWQSAPNAAQIQAAGYAPAHTLESAIMVTLNPGAYTVICTAPTAGTERDFRGVRPMSGGLAMRTMKSIWAGLLAI